MAPPTARRTAGSARGAVDRAWPLRRPRRRLCRCPAAAARPPARSTPSRPARGTCRQGRAADPLGGLPRRRGAALLGMEPAQEEGEVLRSAFGTVAIQGSSGASCRRRLLIATSGRLHPSSAWSVRRSPSTGPWTVATVGANARGRSEAPGQRVVVNDVDVQVAQRALRLRGVDHLDQWLAEAVGLHVRPQLDVSSRRATRPAPSSTTSCPRSTSPSARSATTASMPHTTPGWTRPIPASNVGSADSEQAQRSTRVASSSRADLGTS